jgi:hypothetical protein
MATWIVEAVVAFEAIDAGTVFTIDPDTDARMVAMLGHYLRRREDLEDPVLADALAALTPVLSVDIVGAEPELTFEEKPKRRGKAQD